MHHPARLAVFASALAVLGAACSPAPSATPRAPSAEPASSPHSAPTTGSPPASEPGWTALTDAPLARLEMGTAAHRDRIWLAGGLSPFGEAVNEVEIFDPATGEWSSGPALPTGVHHAALVSDGQRLVLIGGYLGSSFDEPTPIVLVLADGAGTWEPGPPLPSPRGAGAAAWDGSRIVFAGGVGPDGVSGDVFALADGAWTAVSAMGRPREHLAATSDGEGRTWLLGGRVGGLDSNLPDVDLLDGSSVTALDQLPTPRGGVAAFYQPTLGACLTGGETPSEALAVVECIDAEGSVTTLMNMTVRRHGHGAAVIGSMAYVILGGPDPGLSAHASVERLEIGR